MTSDKRRHCMAGVRQWTVDTEWWTTSDGKLVGARGQETKVERRDNFRIPCEEVENEIHSFDI